MEKPSAHVSTLTASMDEMMPVMLEILAAGREVCLYPRGVSMRPLIREGKDSVTLAQPSGPLAVHDIVLFSCEGRYLLHRVVAVGKGGYVFCGDNRCDYERVPFGGQVIAVATALCRRGRLVSFDSFTYRCYVRLVVLRRRARRVLRRVARRICRLFGKGK